LATVFPPHFGAHERDSGDAGAGLEQVSGTAWFKDVRIVLAKEAADASAAAENTPIFEDTRCRACVVR